MQFEVPQFIEIEDKIFGPFTLRQFIYIAGGSGVVLMTFFLLPFIFFVVIGLPFGAFAAALAFYPVNQRPFAIFLGSIVTYFASTRLYIWKRGSHTLNKSTADDTKAAPSTPTKFAPPTKAQHIHSLSRKLELNALQND